MSHRMLQVNELLKRELALLVQEEIPLENGLITISNVNCSADLKNAVILISVIPENQSGTSLKNLRKNSKHFTSTLRKKLNLKFVPNLRWKIDSQIRYANELNEMISKIKT